MPKRPRHPKHPAVEYGLTFCNICHQIMTFQQVRQAVYWLPDMDEHELLWARYEGYEHKLAHRSCWEALKPKRQEELRYWSFKNQEPRCMGRRV